METAFLCISACMGSGAGQKKVPLSETGTYESKILQSSLPEK